MRLTLAFLSVSTLALAGLVACSPAPTAPATQPQASSAAPPSKPEYASENVSDPSCNRRCLLEQLNLVVEAVAENTPDAVPLAPNAKITANGVEGPLTGSAVWGPSRRLPYREAFIDPVTGSAVFFGVVTNSVKPPPGLPEGIALQNKGAGEAWWYYALRIKVVNKAITEVEQIDYNPADGGVFGTQAVREMKLADRIWDAVLPESERVSRDELMKSADQYFDVISKRVDTKSVPWHPECQRVEIGVFTTNSNLLAPTCGAAMKLPTFHWNVENRRFYVADVERGIVVALGNFMAPPDFPASHNSAVVFEVFKVQDGMFRYIEAFFRGNKQLKSGWGTGPGA